MKQTFFMNKLIAFLLLFSLPFHAQAEPQQVQRAATLVDGVGVQVHLRYTDGSYRDLDAVVRSLDYVGIKHIRSAVPAPHIPTSRPVSAWGRLMREGYSVIFTITGGVVNLDQAFAALPGLARSYPGAISYIEGFNEVDRAPVTWQGEKGEKAAIEAQKAIFSRVRQDPDLRDIPVADLTGVELPAADDAAAFEGRADLINMHLYPLNGKQPNDTFKGSTAAVARRFGLPLIVTEFGYSALPQKGWNLLGVNREVQARQVVNGILDSVHYGVSRVYIYELLDQKFDPQRTNREMHFGLFDNTYAPKPAATAIRNLFILLRDEDAKARSFTPSVLDADIEGLPTTAKTTAFQKASGRQYLVIWNEPPLWDNTTGQAREVASVPIRVRLNSAGAVENVFNPFRSETALHSPGVRTIDLELKDEPLILEIY